ncbi:uncharacterized protein LOC110827534 isoform X2 [Zootermopsis nevadensis]|uniref:uncharacterized protein LOC110827534 isoform X2 n=1 Tax=Zootermopsis nevadensis TaxID=136037 RepID=UPI000B8E5F04|nr:uncharacterized protein LOC110827534 isoform X2 [Zootermopsis nevadensis]
MNRKIDVSGNHTFSEVLQANDITNVHANTGGAPATFSVYYDHKTGTVDIRMKVASQEQTAKRLKDTCDHKPITGLGKCEYLPRTGSSVVDEPSSYCQFVPLDISTPHRNGSKDSTHGSEDMPLHVRKNYFLKRHHESGDVMVEGGDNVTPIGQTLGEYRKSYTTAVQDHSEWQPRSTISSLISNSAREDIVDEASISAAQRVENPAADIPDTRPQERPNLVIPQNEVASASDVSVSEEDIASVFNVDGSSMFLRNFSIQLE